MIQPIPNAKKRLSLLFILLMLMTLQATTALGAASAKKLKVVSSTDSVKISKRKLSLTTSVKKVQLKATCGKKNVTRTASWSSSAPDVVKVSARGKLTIKNPGTASILCSYRKTSYRITVDVRKAPLTSGIPSSRQQFIRAVAKIARKLRRTTHILPSVVIAQCCLETGYGLGSDARLLVKHNNLLGMKSELLNASWSAYSVWNGKSVSKKTPEYYNGKLVWIKDSFRKYPDYRTCITDYENFLLHVQYQGRYKYRMIQGMTDPLQVITIISRNGYATDPSYITKVMNIIQKNNLTKYDK